MREWQYYKKDHQWRWRLVELGNNEILAHGESYVRKIDAIAAINNAKASFDAPLRRVFWKVKS